MAKNQDQPTRHSFDDHSASTQNGWTYQLAGFLNRCMEIRPSEFNKRFKYLVKYLNAAGCPGYSDWLCGNPEAPPSDPTPEVETAALKAILREFDSVYDNPTMPILPPDKVNELGLLRSRAVRALKARLRQLEAKDSLAMLPTADYPSFTKEDLKIIKALKESDPVAMNQYDLEGKAKLSRRTIGPRLETLSHKGLVHYPHGKRKGAALTPLGKITASSFE
ncbi:MAG: hypothetical protein ACJ8FY_14535 [Gemmataceae bacterium]